MCVCLCVCVCLGVWVHVCVCVCVCVCTCVRESAIERAHTRQLEEQQELEQVGWIS